VSQSQRAYEQLRDEIVAWELQPSAPFNEVDLAERVSVWRTPVREARGWLTCERGLFYVTCARCCGRGEHHDALGDHAHARPRSPVVPFEVVAP
jgi:hypothetical protein